MSGLPPIACTASSAAFFPASAGFDAFENPVPHLVATAAPPSTTLRLPPPGRVNAGHFFAALLDVPAPLNMLSLEQMARAEPIGAILRALDGGARRVDVQGAAGGALGFLARSAVAAGRRLVCVTADPERATALAADVAFCLDGPAPEEAVLRLPAVDPSPYLAMSPDRRAVMERLAILFRLSQGLPWSALVLSAPSLVRRVLPKPAMARA